MRQLLPRLPPVLLGWPRRAAAGLCFALALLSALSSGSSRAGRTATGSLAAPDGTVATSAAVYADAVSFVRPGDRIELVETAATGADFSAARTTPVVVARDVRVLAVRPPAPGGDGRTAQLLVAAPPTAAIDIAAHQGAQVLAAIRTPP